MNKEDWEVKKLENCFEFIRNGANIKQDSFAKGFPITRIETLSNDVFNRDRLGYANIFETEKYKKYLLYDKDILMSHINSMKYLGRAVLYIKKSDEIIIHGMNLLNLRAIKSILRPEFACYYFGSRSFKSDIYKIAKKAVNQASFTISSLKNISIPIPPLPIQTQIVAELGELNAILDKKRKQLEELDTLAQATFYDMFGDPVLNEKGWEVKKLKDIVKKIGSGSTPRGGNKSYKAEGISFIRSLNIHNGAFSDHRLAFIDEKQARLLKNVIVEENDVLLNITGASVARCCVVPIQIIPARVNQHVSIIRLKPELANYFYVERLFISKSCLVLI